MAVDLDKLTTAERKVIREISEYMRGDRSAVKSVHGMTGRNLRGKQIADRDVTSGIWYLTTDRGRRVAQQLGYLTVPAPPKPVIKPVLSRPTPLQPRPTSGPIERGYAEPGELDNPKPVRSDRGAVQEMAAEVDRVTKTSELDALLSIRSRLQYDIAAVERVIAMVKGQEKR